MLCRASLPPRKAQRRFTANKTRLRRTSAAQHSKIDRRAASGGRYRLRWRILARIRRFFCPSFRRPLPDFFTPTDRSEMIDTEVRSLDAEDRAMSHRGSFPQNSGLSRISQPRPGRRVTSRPGRAFWGRAPRLASPAVRLDDWTCRENGAGQASSGPPVFPGPPMRSPGYSIGSV